MGELSPQLPGSKTAGAGSGGAFGGGRAPGPSAAPPGSAAFAPGAPRSRYLPSSRAHMGRCRCASGWRGTEARPAGPSPSFHLLVPGAQRQQRLYSRPLTRYFRGREFPGSPTPRPHSAPPLRTAPALTPGSAPPRGGGAAATCARCQSAHRNQRRAHPVWSAPRLSAPARAAGGCGPLLSRSP